MSYNRPSEQDIRYSGIKNYGEKRREIERDDMQYEQNELLTNLGKSIEELSKKQTQVVIDNSGLEREIQKQNELNHDRLMLDILKGEEREEYIRQIEEREYIRDVVRSAFSRGEKIDKIVNDLKYAIEEASFDTTFKVYKDKSNAEYSSISREDYLGIWFGILMLGGILSLMVYNIYQNIVPAIITGAFLILYPIYVMLNNSAASKAVKDTTQKDRNIRKICNLNIEPSTDYLEEHDRGAEFMILDYKEYVIKKLNNFKDNYENNKQYFDNFNIGLVDKAIKLINNI